MPAVDDNGVDSGGRRPKAWFGGNRGSLKEAEHIDY